MLTNQSERAERAWAPTIEWYLALAKPNRAHAAIKSLMQQSFETFMPLERYTQRRGSALVSATRPYFSGYFFIGGRHTSAPWRAIRSTLGVARLVCANSTPVRVPPDLVDGLRRRCNDENVLSHPEVTDAGDAVEVTDGAFAGFVGTIERLAPGERAWVLIEHLTRERRVSIPKSQIRPLFK